MTERLGPSQPEPIRDRSEIAEDEELARNEESRTESSGKKVSEEDQEPDPRDRSPYMGQPR